MHALLHLVPLTLQQATANPHLCQRHLDTDRHGSVSLLWGHCSFFLGADVQKDLFVPSKSLLPQSCVSSDGSVVGLMVTSSKTANPHPGLLHRVPLPLWQATADPDLSRRHSDTVLTQSLWVGHAFCTLPCLRGSGDQVLGKHTDPGRLCISITSPALDAQFPRCTARAPYQMCHISPLES